MCIWQQQIYAQTSHANTSEGQGPTKKKIDSVLILEEGKQGASASESVEVDSPKPIEKKPPVGKGKGIMIQASPDVALRESNGKAKATSP